jgi:hypothetical protein
VGVNQKGVTQNNDIPIRNKGLALKNAARQRAFKPNMTVRKLRSGVTSLRVVKEKRCKTNGRKTRTVCNVFLIGFRSSEI